MINRTILTGRLTKDPELRMTQTGTSVCSFTLAVDRQFKKEGQPEVDFINCVAWNKTAELMDQYLHKGSLVGVEGRIQTRSYDNQQGQRVYVTEVVTDNVQFLEPKNASSQSSTGYGSYQQPVQPSFEQPQPSHDGMFGSTFDSSDTLDIASDDLPF